MQKDPRSRALESPNDAPEDFSDNFADAFTDGLTEQLPPRTYRAPLSGGSEASLSALLSDMTLAQRPASSLHDAPLSMTPSDDESAALMPREEDLSLADPEPEPDHIVLLCGGGHLAQEVARQAHRVGFAIDVLEMREDYAQPERFPEAREVIFCERYELEDVYDIEPRHYVVILTHSYETDLSLLSQSLTTEARYIGVAASERKKESLFTLLREQGVPDAELACVRCPIGLNIGAASAEEMGIAITAELIAARAGCLPRPVRPRPSQG